MDARVKNRRPRTDPLVRLMSHVDKNATTGCWHWTANLDINGYGQFRLDPTAPMIKAHRAAYMLLVGPIPEGLSLDHLCRVHDCVNPDHVEPVTPQTNTDRGLRAKQERCTVDLHDMTPNNTGDRADGRRYCKECHRLRASFRRRRAAIIERWVNDCQEATA